MPAAAYSSRLTISSIASDPGDTISTTRRMSATVSQTLRVCGLRPEGQIRYPASIATSSLAALGGRRGDIRAEGACTDWRAPRGRGAGGMAWPSRHLGHRPELLAALDWLSGTRPLPSGR